MTIQATVQANFPRMLRVGEAASILHVHPNTLRKWSSNGLIPSYRIGHRRDTRFTLEALYNFLEVHYKELGDQQDLGSGSPAI